MTTETTEVAVIPRDSALQVFQQDNGLDPYLQKIREEIDGFVPDVSTKKGRDAIASIAHKVARSKTALDNVGKELVAELKELPKKIDAERKRMRDTLDAWKDEVRRPLTAWEEAESARIAAHRAGLDRMRQLADHCLDPTATADEMAAWLAEVDFVVVGDAWEEFQSEAERTRDKALLSIREALERRRTWEAEQAELAELRRKQAEQEQKDREERIAREAAEAAQRQAEDQARQRENEIRLQAERAERERLEAIRRAEQAERDAADQAERAAQAERERIEAEQRAEQEAIAKREADTEHRKAINRAALAALIAGGMTEEAGKAAITLIATGKVPAVRIVY